MTQNIQDTVNQTQEFVEIIKSSVKFITCRDKNFARAFDISRLIVQHFSSRCPPNEKFSLDPTLRVDWSMKNSQICVYLRVYLTLRSMHKHNNFP